MFGEKVKNCSFGRDAFGTQLMKRIGSINLDLVENGFLITFVSNPFTDPNLGESIEKSYIARDKTEIEKQILQCLPILLYINKTNENL